ncbi:MAG TPA: YqgE/AlgH family protein [Pilimelia sp.]|nr:YqgE/AlgH family protein [Pilimelia sp.]
MAPDSMARLADPSVSRAVLIGTARYDHLAALPAVTGNLEGLADALGDGLLWGLPRDNCRVLLDPVTPREVDIALSEAAGAVRPGGLLLVYYAGHGLVDVDTRELFLALRDTVPTAMHATAVPYDWVRRNVRRSAADRRLIVLDCCYAGRADMAADDGGTVALADKARVEKSALLVAAAATEAAQAPPGERYTAFTGELITLLRGGLVGGPRLLDVKTIWVTLRERLLAKGFPGPQVRARNSGDDIPVVRNAALHSHDLVGRLVVAAPHVTGPDLREGVLLVLRYHPERGALGVRLNQPTDHPATAVAPQWDHLLSDPPVVFDGGPVPTPGFLALAQLRPDATPPTRFSPVAGRLGTVALSADATDMDSHIGELRLCRGYLGWAPGELESDLESGVLQVVEDVPDAIFSPRPHELWHELQT